MNKIKDCFKIGYEIGLEHIEKIKGLLKEG